MSFTAISNLFGTLDIEGDNSYYIFLKQNRTAKVWVLTDKDIFNVNKKNSSEHIIAVVRSKINGTLEGCGKTFILMRLITYIGYLSYMSINQNKKTSNSLILSPDSYSYKVPNSDEFIDLKTDYIGASYTSLEMYYEGFKLNMSIFNGSFPFIFPNLYPIQDEKSKAAITANLGIKTAESLFRKKGKALDWFKRKDYKLIDTDEKFNTMMLKFITDVQKASDNNKTIWVGLDTETTGLRMFDLSYNNPYRDHVVAIPFGWEDDKAFLICTDMFYFNNVNTDLVYPLFDTLFKRNKDFSFQDIDLTFQGNHFSFNRKNITVTGWNAIFDEMAFFTENCDVFFDEDGRQLYFNLDTDLVQGKEGREQSDSYKISNSLKAQTRRMLGDETVELDELFGKGHEDKFRYLQDETLALIYGGADADYTRIVTRMGRNMTEPLLYKQYRKYDMTIMYKMARASWSGMPIDTEEVKVQADKIKQDLDRLKDFIYHYAWLANRNTLAEKADNIQQMLGLDSIDDVDEVLQKDKMFRYPFTPDNHKRLLFGILGYPVISKSAKSGTPALDKFVLKKLMEVKRKEPVTLLNEDLMSLSDPDVKLVDKEKFNTDAYPLARVFSTYATLNKEYTSYYKPIQENDMEGKMFYNITMARAATRRILSPAQTMKGSLKSLVIAPPGQIFMSFDASQIEYRHMASLAYIRIKKMLQQSNPDNWEELLKDTSVYKIYNLMQKEEADYHIETASVLTGTKQHEITPKVRKQYKCIGFGIPYGLGDRALCANLHPEVNEETMKQTRELLTTYKTKQKEIIDLLESARDSAFIPSNISAEYRHYLGVGDTHVGIVRNFVGFYRLFVLEDLTRARTGRIRRQAGNCIIQGGAAELFRRMLYNFHIGCCKYGIQDKIHWLMTVHDELDATVDSDIDILLLIKVLYENCTLRYQDHIPYYIGINFGSNWYDAKADDNELPVIMVDRMIKAYDSGKFSIPSDGNQSNNLLILKRHYLCDRIGEELIKIIPKLGPKHIWTEEEVSLVDEKFTNYVVRSYLKSFSKSESLYGMLTDWQKHRDDYGFYTNFLQHKLKDMNNFSINEMDLDNSLNLELDTGLSSDLLSDFDDFGTIDNQDWFDENSMFDADSVSDSVVNYEERDIVINNSENNDYDDEYVINDNPTSAFDVFIEKKYVRTKVLRVKDNEYALITRGTEFKGREEELSKFIKSQFGIGSDKITIIGPSIISLDNIHCSDEYLDTLDKMLKSSLS